MKMAQNEAMHPADKAEEQFSELRCFCDKEKNCFKNNNEVTNYK